MSEKQFFITPKKPEKCRICGGRLVPYSIQINNISDSRKEMLCCFNCGIAMTIEGSNVFSISRINDMYQNIQNSLSNVKIKNNTVLNNLEQKKLLSKYQEVDIKKEIIEEMINKYKINGNWDEISLEYNSDTLLIISSIVQSIGYQQYCNLVKIYSRNFIEQEKIDIPSEEGDFGMSLERLQINSPVHDLSSCDIVSKSSVFAIDKKTEMHQVQRIRIPYSETLSKICQLSKQLRNRAVFLGRQLYFLRTNKKNYNLAKQFPKLAEQLLSYMETKLDSLKLFEEFKQKLYINPSMQISNELFHKLKTFESSINLYNFLKFENSYQKLGEIYSILPQQVLRNVASDWKSYYNSYKSWIINRDLFEGEPRIPSNNRKTKEYLLTFPGMFVNNQKYASSIVDHYYNTIRFVRNSKKQQNNNYKPNNAKYKRSGELILPKKFLNNFPITDPFPSFRTTIDIQSIIEVKIVPRNNFFEIQIVYQELKIEYPTLNILKAYSIDIGVNNLIAMTNNFGEQPILIRGKLIKSINQWMNKKIGYLRSVQTQGKIFIKGVKFPETMEMSRIRNKRNSIIEDYFHKVSRFVINQCLTRGVKNLAIGYNAGWKKNIEMSKINKQNFNYIPFLKLIEMIRYKTELFGIKFISVGESHTSKCSAVDFESIGHHNMYLGERGIILKGNNKKEKIRAGDSEYKYYKARGLFKTKDGHIVHSDINASYNIGRRAFPDLFNEYTLLKRNMLQSPKVFKLYEYKKGSGVKSNLLNRFVKASCILC